MSEFEAITKRYSIAKANAKYWHNLYKEVYKYTQPERNSFEYDNPGSSRDDEVYDSIGISATNAFSAKLQSTLTPPFQHWQKFQAGPEIDVAHKDMLNQELEKVTDLFFRFLNESNFNVAVSEAYYDLACGTAALYVRQGPSPENPILFQAVPISTIYPEESPFGLIETVFRDRINIPVRDIKELWPKGTMSSDLAHKLSSDPNAKTSLIEATIYIPEKKKYRYMVLETEVENAIIDSLSPSSPWIVFRWEKRPGNVFGVGPAIFARATLKTINAMAEDELRSAAMKFGPMWIAWDDGVFNPYNFTPQPNTVLVVGGLPGAHAPIQPIPVDTDIRFEQLKTQELKEQVMHLMYADLVRPVNAPQQTATEVLYRKQIILEQIGPAMGRLQVEYLPRLTKRVVYLLQEQGLFPRDFNIDGKKIRLEYTSPLARSQDQSELQSYQEFIQLMNATVGPQLTLASLTVEKLPLWLAEKTGLDTTIVKNEAQLQREVSQAAEAAQQQQTQLPGAAQAPTIPQG